MESVSPSTSDGQKDKPVAAGELLVEDINSDEEENDGSQDLEPISPEHKPKTEESDDIDKEPEEKKLKLVAPPPPNMLPSGLSICKSCNLVFYNKVALESHTKTENHKMVISGLQPSVGKFFCFLCWGGFKSMDDLRTHYNREAHERNVTKHRVKAIWMNTGGEDSVTQDLGTEEIRSRSTSPVSPSPSIDSLPEVDMSAMPDVVPKPPPPSDSKCIPCNMTFLTNSFMRRHLASANHEARVKHKRHPIIWKKLSVQERKTAAASNVKQDRDGDCNSETGKGFSCFLCWVSFSHANDLSVHYKTTSHKRQVKKAGVKLFIEDFTVDLTESQIEDFVVLDEVGSGDEASVVDDSKTADTPVVAEEDLDDVSSDDNDDQLGGKNINQVILEDVNSPEHVQDSAPIVSDTEIEGTTAKEEEEGFEPLSDDELVCEVETEKTDTPPSALPKPVPATADRENRVDLSSFNEDQLDYES